MPTVTIDSSISIDLAIQQISILKKSIDFFKNLIYSDDFTNNWLNLNEFAVTVTYQHAIARIDETYSCLFDDPHVSFTVSEEPGINSLRPQIMVSTNALKIRPNKSDYVFVENRKYFVDDYEQDGTGTTTIYLRSA
jgi:hypothetical protein